MTEFQLNAQRKACARPRSLAGIKAAQKFYEDFFGHPEPTPLLNLPDLAKKCGLGALMLKDESRLLTLQSFKPRGSFWAIANHLAVQAGLSPDKLRGQTFLEHLKSIPSQLFLSATDGNHGRGLAWACALFNQKARIFMPRNSSLQRAEAIRTFGAQCDILDLNYDETVAYASSKASELSGVLIQDTAWPGYEQMPTLIMDGYGVIMAEIASQIASMSNPVAFTHVFLQAGVGSFAAAMIMASGFLRQPAPPFFISIEPVNAACVYESIRQSDGLTHTVKGALQTTMAGLSCGVVSSLAWPVLRDALWAAVKIEDCLAEAGMRVLSEYGIVSGESGAPGAGLLLWALNKPEFRSAMRLDENSSVLLISTEGATDAQNWRKVTGRDPCSPNCS